MDYTELVESIVDDLLIEDFHFWSDVNKKLAVGLSLDPNHIGLENVVGKGWNVTHNPKGVGKFPTVIGSGKSLQHAFADALGRIPKEKPKEGKSVQSELF